MNKKLVSVAGSLILCSLIYGCNAGNNSTATPTISAQVTAGNCKNMTSSAGSNTCTIQLTWNTNGATNVGIAYTSNPNPLQSTINNPTFNNSLASCQGVVTTQTTCLINILYTGGGVNTSLNFTLGNGTSNTINVTGN